MLPPTVLATDPPRLGDATAEQILAATAERYASLSTYQDTAVATTLLTYPNRLSIMVTPYRAAFVRPGRLRYAIEGRRLGGDERAGTVLWWDGGDLRQWLAPFEVERFLSCRSAALGSATPGVGRPNSVLQLLLDENDHDGAPRLTDLRSARRLDDGIQDGVRCDRIEGQLGTRLLELWIDQRTRLIRRIDQAEHHKSIVHVHSITIWRPIADEPVDEAELEYGRPLVSAD